MEYIVNGTYACENNKTLNGLLKEELGFQGCQYAQLYLRYADSLYLALQTSCLVCFGDYA
jgi:hypothetical protein